MLVLRQPVGWIVIPQRAHALLAFQIARGWTSGWQTRRWPETLAAICRHDDGHRETEPGPWLNERGEPRDFTETPVELIVELAARCVAEARQQSHWTGLLVSQHMERLHGSRRSENAALARLLDDLDRERAVWRERLGVSLEENEAAYEALQLADRLSLALCREELAAEGSELELGQTPAGQRVRARRLDDGRVGLWPWPYRVRRLTVGVERFPLEQRLFESPERFLSQLMAARPNELSWELAPAEALSGQRHRQVSWQRTTG